MRVSRHKSIAVVGAGALALAGGTALATAPSNQTAMPLARGALHKPIKANVKVTGGRVKIQTQGALDVIVLQVTIPPGGGSDWHKFAGPHFTVVKQGTLTVVDAGCKRRAIPAGSADFAPGTTEQKNLNLGSTPAVWYVTFLLPHGAKKPPIPEPAPAGCTA